MTANISVSMLAYQHSVLVRALLAKPQVCHFAGVLHQGLPVIYQFVFVTGKWRSKYLRWCCWWQLFYTLKSGIVGAVPGEVCVLLSSSCRGAVKVDKPGMKGLRYVTRPKNSWSSVMFVGAGKACVASAFPQVWVDTISIIEAAKEIDSLNLHMCFCGLNTKSYCMQSAWGFISGHHVLPQCSHGQWCCLQFWCILGTLLGSGPSSSGRCHGNRWGQRKLQKMVSSEGTVECHKQAGLLVKDDWPVSMVGIQLGEVTRVCKLVSDFLHSGHLVMISADGLVVVMGIQAQV